MKNYYEVLEISENASQEVIEKVYKLFAKKYHPDLNPDNIKEAEEKFKEITEAYETLSDEAKRKKYDELLKYEKKKAEEASNTSSSAYSSYSSKSSEGRSDTPKAQRGDSSATNKNSYDDSRIIDEAINRYKQVEAETQAQMQAEREYQIKKAYNDAYVEALKSMGFNIIYKKTFKEKLRAIINVLIFLIIIVIVAIILYQIPAFREQINQVINALPKI